jgi:hypothetical protein
VVERLDNRMSHEWHVAINRFTADTRDAGDWPHFMYEAKTCADEVPRLALLFQMERLGKLPQIHQQCSCCPPQPVPSNHLTCCLGTKCATCPMLLALDKADMPADQIDQAKAWTCAAHILSSGGDPAGEGYILTVDDRMFWTNVYDSLAQSDEEPSTELRPSERDRD